MKGRVKVVGISGGMPEFEEKTWIFREVDAKKFKNSKGVMIKLTGKFLNLEIKNIQKNWFPQNILEKSI